MVKKPILACGADMKGAFALAEGREAFLVSGFGDLGDVDKLARYEKAIKKYENIFGISPAVVACDIHPGYFSTLFAERYAQTVTSCALFKVQHHEAHIASAVVDNHISGNVIGVAFDGTGFGSDGNMWGGEFFVGSPKCFRRIAHFEYIPMPGGDMAVKEPWRMAISYLYLKFGEKFLQLKIDFLKTLDKREWPTIKAIIDRRLNSPLTSSAGRLFDAVGSLILCRKSVSMEAELPIKLEKIAVISCDKSYDFDVISNRGEFIIDTTRLIKGVVKDLSDRADRWIISAKFHNTIADIIVDISVRLHKRFGLKQVALSGGVFQNRFLTGRTKDLLMERGYGVYTHAGTSTNDEGIPVGQIAIARVRSRCV